MTYELRSPKGMPTRVNGNGTTSTGINILFVAGNNTFPEPGGNSLNLPIRRPVKRI